MEHKLPLAKAFEIRPERFRLLEKGLPHTAWKPGMKILEAGCSVGDASAYLASGKKLDMTAFDISGELIRQAEEKHGGGKNRKLRFLCADAAELPFADGSFDGLFSESAFSPMPKKREALREYCRVLRPGGRLLIHDFVIRNGGEELLREEVVHIPCFAGVQTRECYEDMMQRAGFRRLRYQEEYGELIRVTLWLCKVYGVGVEEIGGYLSTYFHSGVPGCGGCGETAQKTDTFFQRADLSYCQMIYEKI